MFKKILLALTLAVGLSSSAWAQNPTCPTRPLGDNSNACASTAFVQSAFGGCTNLGAFVVGTGSASQCSTVSGTIAQVNGTFIINPPSGTLTNGLQITQNPSGTVSPVPPPFTFTTANALNFINVPTDTVNNGDFNELTAFAVIHKSGGAAVTGQRSAAVFEQWLNGNTAPGLGELDIVGSSSRSYGQLANGHNFIAGNSIAALFTGAGHALGLTGFEIDMVTQTGTSMDNRLGLSIILVTDSIQGTVHDAAFSLFNTSVTGGWKTGLEFNVNTISSGGVVLDASALSIGGPAFLIKGPGSKFTVDGNGNIVGNNLNIAAGVSTPINVNGSTSGVGSFIVPAVLGTRSWTLPLGSGTFAITATGPIVLDASTGNLTCPTCATTSGGGGITGTAPISVSAGGVISLDTAGVTYAKIQNLGALAVMGRSANTSGVGADIQATAASDAVLRESGSTIGFGTIATGGIANNAVTLAKLATQATNTVLANVTAGSAVPTAFAMPSCSTASSVLIWTTNTGFGCNASIIAGSVAVGGITGLGAGVATWLATPSSANLATAVTDETGSGSLVFGTSPILSTVDARGTWTTGTSWTLPAHTLAGTVSGGGNQINNIIIGNSTPLAGSFTTLIGTGGTHTGITSLGLRDTSAAFDVTIAATSSSALSAGRTLTLNMGNVAHTLAFGTTANTITFPNVASDTVGMLATTQTWTGANTFSPVGATAATFKTTGGGSSLMTIDTSAASQQAGFQLADNGTGKWLFVKQTDQSFLLFDNANSVSALVVTPGAIGAGIFSFGYTTDSTSSTTGSIITAGGLGVAKSATIGAQLYMPALASDTATTDATVCIATGSSPAGKFLKGTGTLGICLGTSGRQFKTAFEPMLAGMDEIAKIKLWNYRYRDGFGDGGARKQYGPTAQDVAEVVPDLVRYDDDGIAINYDMGAFIPIALHAIQQLNDRTAILENRK